MIQPLIQLKHTSPVIVVGMHRSGTSMLTRHLCTFGFYMGRRLSGNAESLFFQRLNRGILAAAEGKWSNVMPVIEKMHSAKFVRQQVDYLEEKLFKKSEIRTFLGVGQCLKLWLDRNPSPWGWKDPRNSITLSIWLQMFPQAKVVHVVRNGIDVSISLHRRETNRQGAAPDFSEECLDFGYCFRLWEQYLQICWEHRKLISKGRYLEIRYEDILRAPKRELSAMLAFLNWEVSDQKLTEVASAIDFNRLDNEKHRQRYQKEITNLPPSPFMARLGYT
jgi:hypothetical protein